MDSTNKNKIIFIHFNNNYSGSPKVLKSVIDAISDENDILITNNTEGFLSNIKNIKYKYFKFELRDNKIITFFTYFLAQMNIFIKVFVCCEKDDLLYINTVVPIFAAISGKLKGAKILFHLHEDTSCLNIVHRNLSKLRPMFCDTEIFVSKYLYEKEHVLGIKSYILPNTLSVSFLNEGQSYDKRDIESDFNLIMICSLKKYKGVYEFLKVANKLIAYNSIKFILLLSDDEERIKNYFTNIIIPKNVLIYSKVIDTINFYKNASVLLSLSRPDEWIETFGLTILEAMAFGLPCIVPKIGGPIELIEDGINGFRVSAYDIDEVVEKILLLYNDKKLYKYISNNNKLKSKEFSYDSFSLTINKIIQAII